MTLRIDIISDVMCPWCIVGYKQLEQALTDSGQEADIHWHPFELNPQMPPEGQNLREHLAQKYGSTVEQSQEVRHRLKEIGTQLGFAFNFKEDSRIFNTFQAHQLIHWAGETGKDHDLKQALFTAYFSEGKDVSQANTLIDIAASVGLDADEARAILSENRFEDAVRQKQAFWHKQGISGVPAMVFSQRHLVTGAQGTENYSKILTHLANEPAE